MPPRAIRATKFQILMTTAESDQLGELSLVFQLHKAEVVRRCLRNLYRMKIGGIPICSNGDGCLFPNVKLAPPAELVLNPLPASLPGAPEPLQSL